MNKKSMLLGVTTLLLAGAIYGTFASSSIVEAYQGDPTVKGPDYTPERHEAMTEAFDKKDYQAWQKLVEGRGVSRRINQANFARFAEAHQLTLEGKTAEAQKIREELGLGLKNGSGEGQGMKNGRNSR